MKSMRTNSMIMVTTLSNYGRILENLFPATASSGTKPRSGSASKNSEKSGFFTTPVNPELFLITSNEINSLLSCIPNDKSNSISTGQMKYLIF